ASPRADEQPLNDESQGGSLLSTAGTAWPVSPINEGAADTAAATSINTADAASNAVQLVDPNDRAASAEASWLPYAFVTLGRGLLAQLSLGDAGRGAHCRIRNVVLFKNEIPEPLMK